MVFLNVCLIWVYEMCIRDRAIPGGEFEIRNDSIISDVDTIGELVYKGKNVSLGYAECLDDLMRGDDNKGVLYTGDLAYRDKDGFYYIAGRKKRFLKLYGNRISLDYTESLLNQQFGKDVYKRQVLNLN